MKLYLIPLIVVGGFMFFFGEPSTLSQIEEVPVEQAKTVLINTNNFITSSQLKTISNEEVSPVQSILSNNISRMTFTYLGLAMCHYYFPLNDPRKGFVSLGITVANMINILYPHTETKYMFIHESAAHKREFLKYKENKGAVIADSIPREYNQGSGCMVMKVTSQNPSLIYRPLNLIFGLYMVIEVDHMINFCSPEKDLNTFCCMLAPAIFWTHTNYQAFVMNSLKSNPHMKFLIDGSKKT